MIPQHICSACASVKSYGFQLLPGLPGGQATSLAKSGWEDFQSTSLNSCFFDSGLMSVYMDLSPCNL